MGILGCLGLSLFDFSLSAVIREQEPPRIFAEVSGEKRNLPLMSIDTSPVFI